MTHRPRPGLAHLRRSMLIRLNPVSSRRQAKEDQDWRRRGCRDIAQTPPTYHLTSISNPLPSTKNNQATPTGPAWLGYSRPATPRLCGRRFSCPRESDRRCRRRGPAEVYHAGKTRNRKKKKTQQTSNPTPCVQHSVALAAACLLGSVLTRRIALVGCMGPRSTTRHC